jgi:hypothetical protein
MRGTFPPPCGTLPGTFRRAKRPAAVLKRPATSGTLGDVTATATPNERLRTAMQRTGTTIDDLARCCGVDPKSVERWLSLGRVPHRANRWDAARRLGADETWLWPTVAPSRRDDATQSELVRMYPNRADVPRDLWARMLEGAREDIAVLVMSGTFYQQTQPRITRDLAAATARGVRVRLCFGMPSSEAVAIRDREEGIGGTLAAKIRSALTYYRDAAASGEFEMRLHSCTLYASLFRYDDEIIVNPHAFGEPAVANPALHLRRLNGGQVAVTYMHSFERVWDTAKPWTGEDV